MVVPKVVESGSTHGVRGNVTFLFYGVTFNRIRTEESALAKSRVIVRPVVLHWMCLFHLSCRDGRREKTQTGFLMVSPKTAMERRQAGNED